MSSNNSSSGGSGSGSGGSGSGSGSGGSSGGSGSGSGQSSGGGSSGRSEPSGGPSGSGSGSGSNSGSGGSGSVSTSSAGSSGSFASSSNSSQSSHSNSSNSTSSASSSSSSSIDLDPDLDHDAVPETPETMPSRPYVNLTMSFTKKPHQPGFKKTFYLKSGGASGAVEFDNNMTELTVELTENQPLVIKIYGKTVSGHKNSTEIQIRESPNGPIKDKLPITVWKVVVKNSGNPITSGVPASPSGYVYIGAAPAMPAISANLIPSGLSGNVDWNLLTEYLRPNRDQSDSSVPFSKTVDAGSVWNVDFNGGFYGGQFTVTAKYETLTSDKFIFYVRAKNSDIPQATIAAYIDSIMPVTTYIYAKAMAKEESNNGGRYMQFNVKGTLGPDWEDYLYCPNQGGNPPHDYGWGIYQLTSLPVPITTLWSWKANIDEAHVRMAQNRVVATTHMNNMIALQMAQNPSATLENQPPFVWNGVGFKVGTDKTPIDACATIAYNGVTPGWPIYWDKEDGAANHGKWRQRDNSQNYLYKVCAYLK
jgi:hypothetical protein